MFLKSEILHPVLEVDSRAEQSFSVAAKMLEMDGDRASVSLKGSVLSNSRGNMIERRLLA